MTFFSMKFDNFMHCWCAFVCVSVEAYIAYVFTFIWTICWLIVFSSRSAFLVWHKTNNYTLSISFPLMFLFNRAGFNTEAEKLKYATSASLMSYFCVGKGFFLLASTLFIHFINDLLNYCSCNPLQTGGVEGGYAMMHAWDKSDTHSHVCLVFISSWTLTFIQSRAWSEVYHYMCDALASLHFFF